MPAWSADLTTDEVDALAGFILSPVGSEIFFQNCGACHDAPELVAGDPLELKNALAEGRSYQPHAELDIPEWAETLTREQRTALVNFLIAPDGQRLFAINCSPCHGTSIGFSGDEADLRDLITKGGAHLEMPPWQEKLSSTELDTLANYVVSPSDHPEAQDLFDRHCSSCHGARVPSSNSVDEARQIIATGGPHETMPVWGNVLTQEQINALVQYTLAASEGTPLEVGQNLFAQNCSPCHGDFGEGGENPSRPDDIIAPISTAEYLRTRDNFTLKQIISQGQPNFGMAPFGSAFGGPLEDDEIDAIVTYIRSWENNPPVELPPEVAVKGEITLAGDEIFDALCYQCHGPDENGVRVAPSLGDPDFQASNTDQDIYDIINKGHEATSMIAWGEILSADQITQLVEFIRQLPPEEPGTAVVSFKSDVLPILVDRCTACHDSPDADGGWDATSYEGVMNTGDHTPVVLPGDLDNSLLALKILGTQKEGKRMPPLVALSDRNIQVILDWIAAGAPNN
jgi:mono/diheme cytochrome c family protein